MEERKAIPSSKGQLVNTEKNARSRKSPLVD